MIPQSELSHGARFARPCYDPLFIPIISFIYTKISHYRNVGITFYKTSLRMFPLILSRQCRHIRSVRGQASSLFIVLYLLSRHGRNYFNVVLKSMRVCKQSWAQSNELTKEKTKKFFHMHEESLLRFGIRTRCYALTIPTACFVNFASTTTLSG